MCIHIYIYIYKQLTEVASCCIQLVMLPCTKLVVILGSIDKKLLSSLADFGC